MKMVGQQHDRFHAKRPTDANDADGLAQALARHVIGEKRSSLVRNNREEVSAAGNTPSTIIGHVSSVA
jgi:hypothetical protein